MMLLSLALTLAGAPPTHIDLLHGAWPVAAPHAAITLHIPTAALRAVLGDAEEHEALPALKAIPRNLVAPGKEILDGIGAPGVHGPQNMFTAGSTGFDPAIAVGDQYVLVINDHMISFFDRNGNQLPSKAGGATAMSSTDFFKTFWQSKLANGQPNPNNINTHLAYNPNILHPDPNGDLSQLGMINEWYDSRCCFDPVSHRFFYLSAARNQLWFNDPKSNPGGKYDTCVRRYYAFAVSKTEDPRDGFNMWMTTASNYADWPRMAVNNSVMLVAHNSPYSGKPFAYVFDKFDLINNNPNPRNFEYYAADFPGTAKVVPVTINGGSAFNYFVGYGANKATHVFGFKTPNSFATNAKLYESSETFGDPLGFQIDNPKWRAGFLYFCFNEQYVQGRYHVRFVRLPCKDVGGNLWTSLSASDGFFDHYFGLSGPGDAPGDQVSYLKPAIAVNKNLDCAIVYGRVGFKTAQPLYPEARFSLLYHNKSSQNPSTLIHKGNFNPGTPMEKRLDLVNAVVDPTDDQTLWFVHAFADQSLNDYRMVIGHVKP